MEVFFQTKKGRVVMNYINGFGASIVIIGAMFKILHLPGGGIIIGFGLAVEACIFALSAFEPVDNDLDWTRVYPQLKEDNNSDVVVEVGDSLLKASLSEKLDNLLANAKIDVQKLESLEQSITLLAEIVNKVSNSVVSEHTSNQYADQLHESVENMSVLNSVYREQIEQKRMQIKEGERLFEGMGKTLDANREMQIELKEFVDNLHAMNRVYDGMIKAMSATTK